MNTIDRIMTDLGGKRQGQPQVQALQDYLLKEIHDGRVPPGGKLPTEKTLMGRFALTRSAVRKVLDGLAVDGLVERRRGSGTFRSVGRSSARRTMLAGVWLNWPTGPYWVPIVRGIREELARWDYHCVIEGGRLETSGEHQGIEALARKALDGFIVAPSVDPVTDHGPLVRLIRNRVPLVLVDQAVPGHQTDFVATHRELGAEEIVNHLVELGHRRIGFFGIEGIPVEDGREQGYRQTVAMHGLQLDPAWVKLQKRLGVPAYSEDPGAGSVVTGAGTHISFESCRQAVDELLNLPRENRPTAVFAINDSMADVLVRLLRSHGVSVPEEMSVTGFGNTDEDEESEFAWLTSYAQPTYGIGRQAARLLMRRIQDPSSPSVRVLLQGKLRTMASTAPPCAARVSQ